METEGSYKPLEQPIAATHLQVVEIICKDVDEIVLQTLKVLNANGIPLEKIRIQCSDGKLSMNCHDIFCSCQFIKPSITNNQTGAPANSPASTYASIHVGKLRPKSCPF